MRKRDSLITVFEARAGGFIKGLIFMVVEGVIYARSEYIRPRYTEGAYRIS